MDITKFGHCCLLIETKGLRILTDPGSYSTLQNERADNIDVILITHEHGDHYHVESLKTVLAKSPHARVITNRGVGVFLDKEKILFEILEHGSFAEIRGVKGGVKIEAFGEKHALIYPGWKEVINTGYFIADRLFYPGDAFYNPGKPVDILALPVSGLWMKISEAIDYAKEIKPRAAFPVHDGMLKFGGANHMVPEKILKEAGIEFVVIAEGETKSI